MSTNPTINIRTRVTGALGASLPFGSEVYVDRVSSALQSDANRAVESLRRAGRRAGIANETIEQALLEAGLTTPAPRPAVTVTASATVPPEKAAKVEQILSGLRDLLTR